jgi:N-acetylglucosamine kinase-like BadF-type ATPase
MALHIGIFGGHQKSTAIAISDAKVLCCVTGKGLNLHSVQHLKVTNRLGLLLHSLAERLNLRPSGLREKTAKLVLALPGAMTKLEREVAESCLILNEWNDKSQYHIADDTWAGLIGGNLERRGICAFAGTGAAVFVGLGDFPGDKSYKIDGWGHILGDFGSGFQLALETFRFIGRALDQGHVPALFKDITSEEPRICGVDDVQRWFDQLYVIHRDDWRVKFASLASVATKAANRSVDPDKDAIRLVSKSAQDMADSIKIAIERFKPESMSLPIVFQGGMFEYSRLYREMVADALRQDYPNEVRMALFRPVVGAGLMACAEDFVLPSPSVCHQITESIQSLAPRERDHLVYPGSSRL